MIDNRRVKIYHPGQRRTCARCQKVADKCKGNSNAKLCEDNGGEKVNVIDAWKNTLASVNYIAWNSEESNDTDKNIIEDMEESEEETTATNVTNCDGFVISNLDEDITIEEIKLILKGAAKDEDIDGISVHPTGSTRSKIIKDIDPTLVNRITKKVDSKSFKGRLLHCRPHVPVTPPKKEVHNKNTNQDENKGNESKHADEDEAIDSASSSVATPQIDDISSKKKTPEKEQKDAEPKKDDKEDSTKSEIPGLSKKEVDKAKKKQAEKLKKEERKKDMKDKKKKGKCDKSVKKVKDLKQHDFMLNSTAIDDKLEGFDFSAHSQSESDGEEEFEDSVETIEKLEPVSDNIETLLTPKPFKSIFAQNYEDSLTTPDTTRKKRTSSFADFSPREEFKRVKPVKSVRTSSLPRPY